MGVGSFPTQFDPAGNFMGQPIRVHLHSVCKLHIC